MLKNLLRWLFLVLQLRSFSCQNVAFSLENKPGYDDNRSRDFAPRMDYDEWTPLGRSDPLKNDPTFDYVPPELDRVQYWLDSHTTEPSTKRDILVLGVTAKRVSPKIPDHFLKFNDGSQQNHTSFVNDFTGSSGAEPPKPIRTTNFRSGPIDYRNQNQIQSIPASYYPSPFYNQKSKPHTVMLPPPLIQKQVGGRINSNFNHIPNEQFSNYDNSGHIFNTQTEKDPNYDQKHYGTPSKMNTQQYFPQKALHPQHSHTKNRPAIVSQIETFKSVYTPVGQSQKHRLEATTPAVSFEKSNLIYHSTQTLSNGWYGSHIPPTPTLPHVETNQLTYRLPLANNRDRYEVDHHAAAASSTHEIVIGQTANIIVEGNDNENAAAVVKHVEEPVSKIPDTSENTVPSLTPAEVEDQTVTNNKTKDMYIVVANSPSSLDPENSNNKKVPVTVVMPANYVEKKSNSTTIAETTEHPHDIDVLNVTDKAVSLMQQNNSINMSVTTNFVRQSPLLSAPSSRTPPKLQPSTFQKSQFEQTLGSPMPQSMVVPRPNPMMLHFMGNVQRPNMAFRPPGPVTFNHILPPSMTHMLPPPSHMRPNKDMNQMFYQSHQFTSQPLPVMFTDTPAAIPSTMMFPDIHPVNLHHNNPVESSDSTTVSSSTISNFSGRPNMENLPNVALDNNPSPLVQLLKDNNKKLTTDLFPSTSNVPTSTMLPISQTTTMLSLTTDPIFSHYKQPAKPIHGPMYLIIQGHSKVKTYKPTVNKYGAPVENNEILESRTSKPLSKFEQFINENTKGNSLSLEKTIVGKKKDEEKKKETKIEQESLTSLVENGFGAFTVPISSATKRSMNSMTTVEIGNI